MFVEFSATDEVIRALADVGRTEDVQFSPDGTRLAVAGFSKDRVLILEIERMKTDLKWDIRFSRATVLKSASFDKPHGLAWANNEVLLVANREGRIPIVRAPLLANSSELLVHPIHLLGASEADYIHTPGSVSLRRLGPDFYEVLICNNYVHSVSRHLLRAEGFSVVSSETVFHEGLDIADGVAFSHSGKWIAVSNHYGNAVFIYRADQIGSADSPVGTLRGVGYPHGLSFSPDDRALFVADAGAPYAHLFVAKEGDWSGARIPSSSIKIMEDETFERGHYNAEEGGPKGLTVSPDGSLICLTHQEEPLVFYDVRDELARVDATPRKLSASQEIEPGELAGVFADAMERMRPKLAAALRSEKEAIGKVETAEGRASEAIATLSEIAHVVEQRAIGLQHKVHDLEEQLRAAVLQEKAAKGEARRARQRLRKLNQSSSWRMTKPLRTLKALFIRPRARRIRPTA